MQIVRRRRIRHLVRELYKTLLGREPDPEGAQHYESLLLRQDPETAVPKLLKAIRQSKEYQEQSGKIATYHVNSSLAAQGQQLINGRPVNHLVSLGNFCLPGTICRDNGLRRYSLPFDWIFSTPQMVRDCLNDDFATFLDQRHYRSTTEPGNGDAGAEGSAEHEWYREKYGIAGMFAHKDPTRESDYLYYVRCVNRFRQIMRSGDTKLFWVIGRDRHNLLREFPLLLESLELRTTNFVLLGIELLEPTEAGVSTMTPLLKSGNHALYRFTPSSFNAQGDFLPDKLDEWAILRLLYRYRLALNETPWSDGECAEAEDPVVSATTGPAAAAPPNPASTRGPVVEIITDPARMNPMPKPTNSGKLDIQQAAADADTVELLFQTILGRRIGNDQFKKDHDNAHSVHYWVQRLLASEEFKSRFLAKYGATARSNDYIRDPDYRVPALDSPAPPSLVLVTGSCMTDPWTTIIHDAYPGIQVQHQIFNNASELEDVPEQELQRAAFQIVQIPLRSVVHELDYFLPDLSAQGAALLEQAFQRSVEALRQNLDAALKYNRQMGIPVFVLNFAAPQSNPLGFLQPKYELSNFSHYIRELNRELHGMIRGEKNVHLIDYDEITAVLGKRFIQDDLVSHINHASCMEDTQTSDDIHLTPFGSIREIYELKNRDATLAVFNECLACYNIVSSDRKIKLVIFDLDGTLWRGVPADRDDIGPHLTEGWPLSMVEAAMFLKKRGILLAIASKNDPDNARRIWDTLYGKRFPLSNFVSTKFGWGPKVDSIAQILQETNLLPGNCLFVDDNPIEREQVKLAFPDIKMLTGPIFTWRRTLLWAAELQVPYVTRESIGRTESIQGSIQRETTRKGLSDEDYLRDLHLTVKVESIRGSDHTKFPRSFELLNKTNQFNTTGRRWSVQELDQYFADGGALLVAEVSDRLTDYGLTAILMYRDGECTQIVMSCRVFGLRVEFALFSEFLRLGTANLCILFRDTGKNALCRKFLDKLGVPVAAEQVTEHAIALHLPREYHLSEGLTDLVTVINGDEPEPAA